MPKKKEADLEPSRVDERLCFVNRELSWLEFNRRVLMEAADDTVPLLERLKFLSIYQSNLREFFMVRIGALTHKSELVPDDRDEMTGWTPSEQIEHVLAKVTEQDALVEGIWNSLKQQLAENSIDLIDFKKISKVDEVMARKAFRDLKPMLSPRIIESGRPFPFLWNEEEYVIASLTGARTDSYVLVPTDRLPGYRVFEIDGRQKVIITSQLIQHYLQNLFKTLSIGESAVISVVRNADTFISQLKADDFDGFRTKVKTMLKMRNRQQPVELIISGKISREMADDLCAKLSVPSNRVFQSIVPISTSFAGQIKPAPGMKYSEKKPVLTVKLKKGEIMKTVEKRDILLSFPFQSIMPFIDLIYEAVDDPDVTSIEITLYRVAASSKVAAALAYAVAHGKKVVCLLELQARFDEQNNIDFSEVLQEAGCEVIFGKPERKVHSKLMLITKIKDGRTTHITQVGTGNYNEVTCEQYCDLSLITAREDVAADAEAAFEAFKVGGVPSEISSLWIAPVNFKSSVLSLLDREKEKGSHGRVAIKVNSMNDMDIMNKLIECSRAGVKVELYIRGICCLRPGIPDETENITVKSVVGRWLEHSRIFAFGRNDDLRIFMGSGDLLTRNLENRVEIFIEVVTPETREQVMKIFSAMRADREKGWVMAPDGTYYREGGGEGTSCQDVLYDYFSNLTVDAGNQPEKGLLARLFGRLRLNK